MSIVAEHSAISETQSAKLACAGLLCLIVSSLAAVIWNARLDWQVILVCLAVGGTLIYLNSTRSFPLLRLQREKRLTGWIICIGLTALIGILLVTMAWFFGAWHGRKILGIVDKSVNHWLAVKLPTVIVQQFLLQRLVVPLLGECLSSRWQVILCGSLIFAGLHAPNPLLMLLTFLAGSIWITLYLVHRQMLPLIASHFLLAVLAAGTCGEYVLNMRVGARCLELLPYTANSQHRTYSVFPGCLKGSVDECYQDGSELVLIGWVSDDIHRQRPTDFAIKIDSRWMPVEFEVSQRPRIVRSKTADQSGTVRAFPFQVRVSVLGFEPQDHSQSAELFAANINGRYAALGRLGEINPHDLASVERKTRVFPVEIDGRIHGIRVQGRQLQIIGWSADIVHHTVADHLWVHLHGEMRKLDLTDHRRKRPDIATSLGSDNVIDCGFKMPLHAVEPWQIDSVRFFVADADQMLHPIPLTKHARTQVASIMATHSNRILR